MSTAKGVTRDGYPDPEGLRSPSTTRGIPIWAAGVLLAALLAALVADRRSFGVAQEMLAQTNATQDSRLAVQESELRGVIQQLGRMDQKLDRLLERGITGPPKP